MTDALIWKQTHETGRPPVKAYDDDAGFDLAAATSLTILPHKVVGVPCRVVAVSTGGHWFLVLGRSSMLWKRGLFVPPAVIDAGFRGPLFVGVKNWNDEAVTIEADERIGQLIPLPTISLELVQAIEFPPSARGDNGFGSTGA